MIKRSRAVGYGTAITIGIATLGMIAPCAIAQDSFQFAKPIVYEFDFDMYPTSISAGDVNNDGIVDLAISGRNVEGVTLILLGEGGGQFSAPIEIVVDSQNDAVAICNLDLNGPLDLVVVMRGGDGTLATFTGVGDGTFIDRVDYSVGRYPSSLVAKDFDNDGDIDFATTNYQSSSVSILLNEGNGALFNSQTIELIGGLQGPAFPFHSTSADFDNDSDIDLVIGHLTGSNISFLRNQGDGSFAWPMILPVDTPVGVAAADMNLDGEIDIVMADLLDFNGRVAVLENQGNAVFTGLTTIDTGGWSWFVATADLNGDAKPDVAMTDVQSGLLLLMPNESQGDIALGAPDTFLVIGQPRFILPVNLDGDCDLDLVVAQLGFHKLLILINETQQLSACTVADLDGDLQVGTSDLLILFAQWNVANSFADFTYDGIVDVADLLFLLSHWGVK
ncbi:MAG: VCBS repeat-containing protein [Planctomycetes bacterium]|nr:VCBS repeat-containing protein [Planctomycetota bacterium]